MNYDDYKTDPPEEEKHTNSFGSDEWYEEADNRYEAERDEKYEREEKERV